MSQGVRHSRSATRKWDRPIKRIDGKPMGYRPIKCATPNCGCDAELNDRTTDGMPSDMIQRKFEQKGWTVGADARFDFCPRCTEAATVARRARRSTLKLVPQETETMSTNPDSAANALATDHGHPEDVPAAMTRADRQLIHAKIQELYVDEATGYQAFWNDAKVAVDLGVPEAWVAEVRDLMFGPQRDISQDVSSLREQAGVERVRVESILLELDSVLPEIQALAKRVTNLSAEAKAARERIASLEDRLLKLAGV
jgi:hypothetical protein